MYVVAGKRTELGLGSVASLPLATARRVASEMREALAVGADPKGVLAPVAEPPSEQPKVTTFGEFAESYISGVEDGWKSDVHRKQWRSSLRDHASALNDVPITAVDTEAVLAVLRPIWMTKAETAKRVRGRIERILDAARAVGLRPRDAINPAAWRGHLALLLSSQSSVVRGHHAALPYREAQAFFAKLRDRTANAARCLEYTILTAARSSESLGATWAEIDLDAKTWTIPAARMKARKEHVVPLSSGAIEVLEAAMLSKYQITDPVFAVNGASRSNMAMAMLLRRMDYGHVTTHGFRSTFRDWAGDKTTFAREIIEHALAHSIQNKAEAAYRRETAIERRRELMQAWSSFLLGGE